MDKFTKLKRIKKMANSLRKKGLTLKEIGKKLDLSKQRVHQILEEQFLNPVEFEFSENLKEGFKIKEILKRGWPDFLIVAEDGKTCAVEVKGKGDQLNKFQKKVCLYLQAIGLPVFISKEGKLNQELIDYFKGEKGPNIFKLLKSIQETNLKARSDRGRDQKSKKHYVMKLQWEALKHLKEKHPEQSIRSLAQTLKIPMTRAYKLSSKSKI